MKVNTDKIIDESLEMYKKYRKGKFIRAITWLLLTTGVAIMASPFITGLWDFMLSVLNIVDDITGSKDNENNTVLKIIIAEVAGLILVGLSLWFFFKTKEVVKKQNLLQINHSSIESATFTNINQDFDDYNVEIYRINQNEEMKELSPENLQNNKMKDLSLQNLHHALREQEKVVEKVLHRLNDGQNMEMAYLGLAHIPLVMLLGYQIADKSKCKFFEFNQNDSSWNGLLEKSMYPPLLIDKEDTIQSIEDTTEVTVRIGVTFPIPKTDLNGLNLEHLNSYYMHLKEPKRNVIVSTEQINEYQKQFRVLLDEIHQRYPNLNKIHLFYSGQPSLAYRLGSAISPRMDREIWIYNNVKSANPQYKWVLKLSKVGEDYSPKIIEEGNNC